MGRLRRGGKWLIGFLEPLKVFKPIKKENGKRDWNLTLVAIAVACESLNYGIFGVKAQYLLFTYGWTSAQVCLKVLVEDQLTLAWTVNFCYWIYPRTDVDRHSALYATAHV